MKDLELKNLVRSALVVFGAEGLVSSDYGCGCELSDLMPCDEPQPDCRAGVRIDPPEDGDGYDFHIVPLPVLGKGASE